MSDDEPAIPTHIVERLDERWQQAYRARTEQDLQNLYRDWSATYDEDHQAIGCVHHEVAANALAAFISDPAARILDAGAGTGIVGERLSEQGFTNLVALDFSEDILQQAQAKGCYQDLIVANLNAPLAEIPDHSFDAVIAVGVFSYGQVQVQALHEMVRITRSQGFLAFTQRVDFHESDAMGFKSHQDSLEASERIVLVCLTEPAQYLPRKDPDVMFRTWVYQVKW